jgi:limonene-1,2-epoxide hydrolase
MCATVRIARRADRRPDLHDERTVPGQLDLSCNVGRLMLKSASLPLSRWVRARQRAAPGRDAHARAAAFKGWDSRATAPTRAVRAGARVCEPGEDLRTEVFIRLVVAMNARDLGAVAGFIHEDYRSEQPAHPGRAFAGRAQMLANWEAMLAGIPDFRAEICRSVQDGETTWTEWRWSGTRSDGQAFEMRGVTLFEVTGGQIAGGRLYLEDVERDVVGIEQAVEDLSGRRPRTAHQ